GILAALLLPALDRAKAQAQRIQCVSQLRQTGLAFHSFAHDHNSKFPMAVPVLAGGSMEFVQQALRAGGEFSLAFRAFQSISNDLVTPKLLNCPTDTRQAAANFQMLKNENLSYFVALNADISQPTSIL